MTMYISCTCLFVICFCFTTGAVEAFLMVCSSLTSHFQGSIIFLMNMKVLLGILYLCSLGYPGSWCLQWPVWSLAVVSTSFCHHLFGACLPPTLTSSQFSCIAPIYTGSSFLPPILTSHFLLPFFCNASPPHFFFILRGAVQWCRSSQGLSHTLPWTSISAFDDLGKGLRM